MRWILALTALTCFACNRGPEIPPEDPHADEQPATMSAMSAEPSNPHAQNPHAKAPHGDQAAVGMRVPQPSIDPQAPVLAGVRWSTREPLTFRPPTRPMRNAEYAVTGDAGEAVLTVFHFPRMGGDLRDNIDRWVGQFHTPEGGPVDDAQIETKTVNGFEVTTVDVQGVFGGGMGGGGTQNSSRMLGAIIAGPEGPIFFKLVGPEPTVTSAESAFEALLDSFEPAAS